MAAKKYSEWTQAEKDAYREKRTAQLADRKAETQKSFDDLESELKKLKASADVMALFNAVKNGAGFGKATAARSSYLDKIFGTDEPKAGQAASFTYIGVRGPNGERLNDGETIGQFVGRVGDMTYVADANTIASWVWLLKKQGYNVEMNRDTALVTYLG